MQNKMRHLAKAGFWLQEGMNLLGEILDLLLLALRLPEEFF